MAFQGRVGNMTGATGGIVTYYDDYVVHTFIADGIFTANAELSCDILMVGGGGAGGGVNDGGAGAGGMIVGTNISKDSGSYSIVVGDGGARQRGHTQSAQAENGDDTTAFSMIAKGGGGGSQHNVEHGADGGSGGGGGHRASSPSTHLGGSSIQASYSGFTSYGNTGGSSGFETPFLGGGGGGAGAVGDNATEDVSSGDGGIGIQNNFRTGNNQYYAGGGGGGTQDGGTAGAGGKGGGGLGTTSSAYAWSGLPNTGGGGGGAGYNGATTNLIGGGGGSGIVVIRYKVEDAEKIWTTRKIGDTLKIDSGDRTAPAFVGLAGTFGKDTISHPIYISRWLTGIEYGNVANPWTVGDTTGEDGTNNFPWYLQFGSAGWSSGRGILTMAKCRWICFYFESDASGGFSGNFSGMGNKTFFADAYVDANKTFANAESGQEGGDFYGESGYSIAGNYNGRYAADTANGRFFGGFNEQNDLGNPFGYCNMFIEIWCMDPTAKLIENHDITL